MMIPLQEQWRYFWRVCAVDAQAAAACGARRAPSSTAGRNTPQAFPPQEPSPRRPLPNTRLDDPGNLAWQGEIWGTGGNMHSPTRAIDGQDSATGPMA